MNDTIVSAESKRARLESGRVPQRSYSNIRVWGADQGKTVDRLSNRLTLFQLGDMLNLR